MREQRLAKLMEFLEKNPEDEFLNYALAQEHIGIGNDLLAKPILKKLILNSPNYIASYYHYGKLLQREEKNEEAIQTFETGIKIGQEIKDNHAVKELNDALNEILYDDY